MVNNLMATALHYPDSFNYGILGAVIGTAFSILDGSMAFGQFIFHIVFLCISIFLICDTFIKWKLGKPTYGKEF